MFLGNFDVSTSVAFFESDFVAYLEKSKLPFILFLVWLYGGK